MHDNLIRNCSYGIKMHRRTSKVVKVYDTTTFSETVLPLEWHVSGRYRGWKLVWLADNTVSTIAEFDPETCRFRLDKPSKNLRPGNAFHIFPPQARWNIHDNTITECMFPVDLDVYGSATSTFRNNMITRGGAGDVTTAVRLSGRFNFIGNQFLGFDPGGCVTIELRPDKLGRSLPNLMRDNVFHACRVPVMEQVPGLWQACASAGNLRAATAEAPLTLLTEAHLPYAKN